MKHSQTPGASKIDWEVESVRLTLFARSKIAIDPQWMVRVAGTEASEAKRTKIASEESAVVGTFRYVVRASIIEAGTRLDWFVVRAEPPDDPSVGPSAAFTSIGTLATVKFGPIRQLAEWVGSAAVPAHRVALGVILNFPLRDIELAYRQLAVATGHLDLTSTKCGDFLYQINRFGVCQTVRSALRLNRLAKWAVMTRTAFEQELLPNGEVVRRQAEKAMATRLELDMNTPDDFMDTFSPSEQRLLVEELAQNAELIAHNGDI